MTVLTQSLLDGAKMGLITLDTDCRIEGCLGKLVNWIPTGGKATESIPFLVGLDDVIGDIAAGRAPSLSLPRVGWGDTDRANQVLSLEVMPSDVTNRLQILVRDETETAVLEQRVLQQRNELSLTHDALTEAKERAETLLHEKTSFLAAISHDLKTPLQVIMGNAEILRDDLSDEERDGFLQDILDNSQFLLTLISDLLDASALDAERLTLTEEPVDVRQLLEQVLSTIRRLPKGRERTFDVSAMEGSTILADPMRLRRILLNVVGNAVKFTEDGGHIVLSAHRTEGGYFLIEVEDDGCGIDPKLIDRVFEPFTMGETSDGSGLGLHIAMGLAELHGGDISLTSSQGQGTKVAIRLPKSRSLDLST